METIENKWYHSPDGGWYKNPKHEIQSRVDCVKYSQDTKDSFHDVAKVLFPGVVYLALRCAGGFAGVGPEVDEQSINHVPADAVGFIMSYFYGAVKASEFLSNLDLRSAKKSLLEARTRLGSE